MTLIVKQLPSAPNPEVTAAKAWLQSLLTSVVGTSASMQKWQQGVPNWNADGRYLLGQVDVQPAAMTPILQLAAGDIADAVGAGNVLETDLQNFANLGILTEVPAISALLDSLSAAPVESTLSLSVTPVPPPAGTNLAADALQRLSVLAQALDSGDTAGAQAALNQIAGDIQAIAAQGATNATGTVAVGGVSTGSAVGIGAGGLVVGGIVGVVAHAMIAGAGVGAREARETKKKKRKRT
jgi:hypothetical protein